MTCETKSKWKATIIFNSSNISIEMGCSILEKQKTMFLYFLTASHILEYITLRWNNVNSNVSNAKYRCKQTKKKI